MSSIPVFETTRALIFDCDGTLADTMPNHTRAWMAAFRNAGRILPVDFIDGVKGMPGERIVEQYNRKFGDNLDPVEIARDKNRRVHDELARSKPIPQVVAIARQYHGMLPMAVASGGTRKNIDRILRAIQVHDWFDIILTADNGLPSKPAPDIFLKAAKKMKVDPEYCQVFEDGDAGLKAAKAAGMMVVDVREYLE
jgi:HAD superfamily hydrolase (TIGR01509 family)